MANLSSFHRPLKSLLLSTYRGIFPSLFGEGWRGPKWPRRGEALCLLWFAFFSSYAQSVAPILGDVWRHQQAPFNKYCPHYDGRDEACDVGCVATSCETIMTYYGRPVTLADTLHGWTTDHYTIADIPPGLSLQPSESDDDAKALLGYWLGVACHMNYGPSSSGANISRLVSPLRHVFGYRYAHHLDSYKYTPDTWRAIILQELQAGRPVLYAGYTCHINGHAFVIDGIRDDGLYHVNWGYGGHYDENWYALDELFFANPATDRRAADIPEGFFCNQEMLLLHPDSIANPLLADTLARTGTEISVDVAIPAQGLTAGRYAPVTFTLTNTAATPLTTPFELISSEPERTDSIFELADYGCLFGATLAPGESRRLTLPVLFSEAGERTLRLSPDDSTVIWQRTVTIRPATAEPSLHFSAPRITPQATSVHIALDVSNTSPTADAGTPLIFCLFPGTDIPSPADGDTRHYTYLYTPAASSETIDMDFRALTPGQTYTLLLRQPWQPLWAEGHTFTLPTESVNALPALGSSLSPATYQISAQPARPDVQGIIISLGRKTIKR